MATTGLCQICGQENEDTYHVFLRCPHARQLWEAMHEVWDMPASERVRPLGKEWLLQLLSSSTADQRARVLMTLWRVWHAHNELTHEKACPSIPLGVFW
jgi:hypothetical protein